jgi:hypothetical protein
MTAKSLTGPSGKWRSRSEGITDVTSSIVILALERSNAMQVLQARGIILENLEALREFKPEDLRLVALYNAAAGQSWAEFNLIRTTCADWDELTYNNFEEEDLKNLWDELSEHFSKIWEGTK